MSEEHEVVANYLTLTYDIYRPDTEGRYVLWHKIPFRAFLTCRDVNSLWIWEMYDPRGLREGQPIKPFSAASTYKDIGCWEIWELLLDAHNSIQFGFQRLPEPGMPINVASALRKVNQIENEWNKEWMKRDKGHLYSGPVRFSNMPQNAQLWFAEEINRLSIHMTPPSPNYFTYSDEEYREAMSGR